jgi:hypothetical protein
MANTKQQGEHWLAWFVSKTGLGALIILLSAVAGIISFTLGIWPTKASVNSTDSIKPIPTVDSQSDKTAPSSPTTAITVTTGGPANTPANVTSVSGNGSFNAGGIIIIGNNNVVNSAVINTGSDNGNDVSSSIAWNPLGTVDSPSASLNGDNIFASSDETMGRFRLRKSA